MPTVIRSLSSFCTDGRAQKGQRDPQLHHNLQSSSLSVSEYGMRKCIYIKIIQESLLAVPSFLTEHLPNSGLELSRTIPACLLVSLPCHLSRVKRLLNTRWLEHYI